MCIGGQNRLEEYATCPIAYHKNNEIEHIRGKIRYCFSLQGCKQQSNYWIGGLDGDIDLYRWFTGS